MLICDDIGCQVAADSEAVRQKTLYLINHTAELKNSEAKS